MNISRRLFLLAMAIAIVIIATLAAIFTVRFHHRQYDNALMEIFLWPGGGGLRRGAQIYRFVVTNDGTLISYYGRNLTRISYVRISDSRLEQMKESHYEWISRLPYERRGESRYEWTDANNYERRHDSLRFIRERRRTSLSEEDFLHISELVERIVTLDHWERSAVLTNSWVIFLHNGNVYENNSGISGPLDDLVRKINRLSPVTNR